MKNWAAAVVAGVSIIADPAPAATADLGVMDRVVHVPTDPAAPVEIAALVPADQADRAPKAAAVVSRAGAMIAEAVVVDVEDFVAKTIVPRFLPCLRLKLISSLRKKVSNHWRAKSN
jgi:hypothetical protein